MYFEFEYFIRCQLDLLVFVDKTKIFHVKVERKLAALIYHFKSYASCTFELEN